MCLRYMVLCCSVLIFICFSSSHAKRVYFKSDGSKVAVDNSGGSSQNGGESHRIRSLKEKLARDAAAAAAMGYTVGQTVKVEKGIIFKLAKDPRTGEYTFKLYRKVKKKRSKTKLAKEDDASRKDRDRKARIDRENQEKQQALALKKEEEERRRKEKEQKERIASEQRALRKAEAAAALREAERLKLKKMYEGANDDGQRLKRGDWVVGLAHRYVKWKTVLTKRSKTTASETTDETTGLGEKDAFYTKAHGDMLLIRYMAFQRLEIFLEAGMGYESISDISDMEPAYGGGFRFILKEAGFWTDSGLYIDFTARYMAGKVQGIYTDTSGNEFVRTSDFSEIEAGLEAGLRFYKLTLSAGLSYGLFSEETKRDGILTAPDVLILNDELEEQDNLGMMLGLNYRMSSNWTCYAQWHAQFKEGALAGMQYRF